MGNEGADGAFVEPPRRRRRERIRVDQVTVAGAGDPRVELGPELADVISLGYEQVRVGPLGGLRAGVPDEGERSGRSPRGRVHRALQRGFLTRLAATRR